jgi:hypothetical protein
MAKAPAVRSTPVRRAGITVSEVCEHVAGGGTLTALAQAHGVSMGGLSHWLHADPERLAAYQQARADAAKVWDDLAEVALRVARTPFELKRAESLANHYRWRAARLARDEYGDKIDARVDANLTVEVVRFGDRANPE